LTDIGPLPNWDLSHLYSGIHGEDVKNDLALLMQKCTDFETAYKGHLTKLVKKTKGAVHLAESLRLYSDIADLAGRLSSYSGLVAATDMLDPEINKFAADIDQLVLDATRKTIFYTLELNQIDDSAIEPLYAQSEELAFYKPFIVDLRLDKPYELSEILERIFAEKSVTGRSAWSRLHEETTAAFVVPVRGEDLTMEAALKNLSDTDPSLRKDSAEALAKVFQDNVRLFSLITNTLAKDKQISDDWHGFEDIADSRHLANRVERNVVEALVSSVEEAYPRLSHRYYTMKAKWLGQDTLNYWDRNAPIPEEDTRDVPWAEARDLVLSAFGSFSPRIEAIAKRFFDENWIDAPVKKGKTSGAFSHSTVPSAHPYILVNYLGKSRDVMTLAHELGHGVHQVLAAKQGPLMAGTPLTLAETASVFGEMLTFRKLLDGTTDPAVRKALLAGKVEDMLNTVVRQIGFYTFEREIHTRRRQGELTPEEIGQLWIEMSQKSLGPAITMNEGYANWWVYISHFIHTPFYVYAYAFGDCLVNALYKAYEMNPEGFEEKYVALLETGGSKFYREVLEPFGLDPSDPQFWNGGLSLIESMIDELETM
jgi:oligoendopeptidase F